MAIINMAYNISEYNQNTFVEFLQQTNKMIGENHGVSFFGVIIYIIFFVMWLAMSSKYDSLDSAIAASFTTFLVSIMFAFAELVTFMYVWPVLIIFIGSLITKVWVK